MLLLLALFAVASAINEPAPPYHKDLVGNARWIVKYTNVSVMATNSALLPGYPFGAAKDVADGAYDSPLSKGLPMVYMSPMATVGADVVANPLVSFVYSASMTHYCGKWNIDNDSPTCGRVVLSGELVKITDRSELGFAKQGFYTRHPDTKWWPMGHNFAFWKLNIHNIWALDFYGGATVHMNVTEYLNYEPKWMSNDL